jgi:DNA-directed RNA polymerase omega subunit
LRVLDEQGIVVPKRTGKNRRLYSDSDLSKLIRVRSLTEEFGVNMNGVRIILQLEEQKANDGSEQKQENWFDCLPETFKENLRLPKLENIAVESEVVPNQPKSRYSLVVLAAKRARQLKDGAPPLVEPTSPNLLTTALQEIAAGKIGIIEAVEEPDDEAPRYIRGGFIASDYEDMLHDAELSSSELSSNDESDIHEIPNETDTSTESMESEQPTEE